MSRMSLCHTLLLFPAETTATLPTLQTTNQSMVFLLMRTKRLCFSLCKATLPAPASTSRNFSQLPMWPIRRMSCRQVVRRTSPGRATVRHAKHRALGKPQALFQPFGAFRSCLSAKKFPKSETKAPTWCLVSARSAWCIIQYLRRNRALFWSVTKLHGKGPPKAI